MSEKTSNVGHDLLRRPFVTAVGYGIPIAAMFATGVFGASKTMTTVIWTGALVAMGATCLLNAVRCRRVHCYFTAPWFLLIAVLVVLHGTGLVDMGTSAFQWLGNAVIAGAVLLWVGSEWIFGRYFSITTFK